MTSTTEWCRGRWPYLLTAFGLDEKFLKNTHGPCPICGGSDRYRFDNKDNRGTWFCNACGNGDGFDLLVQITGRDFKDLAAEIAKTHMPKAPEVDSFRPGPSAEQKRQSLNAVWKSATDERLLMDYLLHRGINEETLKNMQDVRGHRNLRYQHEGTVDEYPAMVAMIRNKSNEPIGLHRTYMMPDGTRAKKVMAPTETITGGAIRLVAPREKRLLVAEGVESALAGYQLVEEARGAGVWATISAHGMKSLETPSHLDHLIICMDVDASFTGQAAAHQLAHREAVAKHGPKQITIIQGGDMGTDAVDLIKEGPKKVIVTTVNYER